MEWEAVSFITNNNCLQRLIAMKDGMVLNSLILRIHFSQNTVGNRFLSALFVLLTSFFRP